MGCVMYLSYAIPTRMWFNPHLIFVSLFVAFFLPFFAKLSDTFEAKAFLKSGSTVLGKLTRLVWQYLFNIFALATLLYGRVVDASDLQAVGGVYGAVLLMSFASQGTQYLVIELANRNIGNRYLNVVLALSFNIVVGALAALGYGIIQVIFVLSGLSLGFLGMLWSSITDISSCFAPKHGVGVFFGTFNPVHVSHINILKKFISERNLSKVYLHTTIIPSFHQGLLDEGVIYISNFSSGMRSYSLTGYKNRYINYFPTGNTFYEAENRLAMLRAAIHDENLEDFVEVLYLPEIYAAHGFRGVIKYVRGMHSNAPIHGLHGSDMGGSIVRMIYDSSFFVWPRVAVRRDKVSATAIRGGAKGMTHPSVDYIRSFLADPNTNNGDRLRIGNYSYIFQDGVLIEDKS